MTYGHPATADDTNERRDKTTAEYDRYYRMHGLSSVTIANDWSFGNTAKNLRTDGSAFIGGQRGDRE